MASLRILRLPLVFAFIAALMAFYPLCLETFRLVLGPEAPLSTEGTTGHILPIPRALLWSPGTKNLIASISLLAPAGVIGIAIALFAILILGALRTLNPTFRLTTGVDWDRTVLTKTYMHTAPLIKAFLILIAALVPLFILWSALYYLTGSSFSALALRLALCGAAAWLLFSREGVAGDYDNLNYELPRDRAIVKSLVLRGAFAGLGLSIIVALWQYTDPLRWFDFYHSLGSVGEGHWRSIVAICCGTAAVLGFGGAALLVALGPSSQRRDTRIGMAALGLGAILLVYAVQAKALPAHLISRYDYDTRRAEAGPDGVTRAAKRLARVSGASMGSPEMDTILIFRRSRVVAWNVPHQSITGINTDPQSVEKIESHLANQRSYTTSLADPAYKTLHDAASRNWDTERLLQIQLTNLERSPEITYMRQLVSKLRSSPRTPLVLKYADMLADESRFTCVTRQAQMAVGDIFARLGEKAKAEVWYRKAGVPESRLPEVLSARTMFANGLMTGRLFLNGQPLPGARVGLVPFATLREAVSATIANGVVRPYWLRWVGPHSVTNSEGRFQIAHIVAGEYRFLLTHPDIKLRPLDASVNGTPISGRIFVGFARPKTDLGDIHIRIREMNK